MLRYATSLGEYFGSAGLAQLQRSPLQTAQGCHFVCGTGLKSKLVSEATSSAAKKSHAHMLFRFGGAGFAEGNKCSPDTQDEHYKRPYVANQVSQTLRPSAAGPQ